MSSEDQKVRTQGGPHKALTAVVSSTGSRDHQNQLVLPVLEDQRGGSLMVVILDQSDGYFSI